MARSHEPANRRARGEQDREPGENSKAKTEDAEERVDDAEAPPQAELRWVQLRRPRRAVEIGRNGRILDSRYHSGYDSWEVLLETYEGELSD
jgi:hypothetical protein